jgi:UDP-glucose 4-epimerase
MGRRVAITGASGFVGGYIAECFKENGYTVTAIGRIHPKINIDEFISADITSGDFLKQETRRHSFDVVIHAAVSKLQDVSSLFVNCVGTYGVLQFALKCAEKLIYISSIPIIGKPLIIPITEQHPVNPLTVYHTSKYYGELLCSLPEYSALNPAILRIPSPIGGRAVDDTILTAFLKCCINKQPITVFGNGGREQCYADTRDIANACLLSAEKPQIGGLFLINGHTVSNTALAWLCKTLSAASVKIQFSATEDPQENDKWIIDGSKAKTLLGYEPNVPLEQSILDIYMAMK